MINGQNLGGQNQLRSNVDIIFVEENIKIENFHPFSDTLQVLMDKRVPPGGLELKDASNARTIPNNEMDYGI